MIFRVRYAIFIFHLGIIGCSGGILNSDPENIQEAMIELLNDDPSNALNFLETLADEDNPEALYRLGRLYNTGIVLINENDGGMVDSISIDHQRGIEYLRRAASLGHSDATRELAQAYSIGEGVPRDKIESERLYRKAIELGNELALYQLGWEFSFQAENCHFSRKCSLKERDYFYDQAVVFLEEAARSSSDVARGNAIVALKKIYSGYAGAPKDMERLAYWKAQRDQAATDVERIKADIETQAHQSLKSPAHKSDPRYEELNAEGRKYVDSEMDRYDEFCSKSPSC